MQTFLPYHPELNLETGYYSFKNSARVLDNKRLGKQRVEGYQILSLLCGKDGKWKNHPAVLQWKGYEWILWDYVLDMCWIWTHDRRYKDTIFDKTYGLILPGDETGTIGQTLPPWMNRPEIFASHRSRLLFKGRVDAAILALKTKFLPKGWKLNEFLEKAALPRPNVFTQQDIQTLEKLLQDNNILIGPNHYAQFNWQETDNIPYVWPVRKEK